MRGPDERPVRPGPGHPLRPRGQPARVAHRAVRGQGDRRAAGQGRRPGHARRDDRRAARRGDAARRTATAARCRPHAPIVGQGGGAAVQAVPHHARARSSTACSARRCARPARSWASTSTSARRSPRPARARSAACPRKGTVFVSVANRDKRAMIFPVKRLADLGFDDRRDHGHRRCAAAQRDRVRGGAQAQRGRGPDGEPHDRRPHPRRRDRHGGQHARAGSATPEPTATRSGRPRPAMDEPIITTVQQLARRRAGHRGRS